ncbi:hypothetical protein [Flavimaricola marinus]|uniref:Excinuclease ABC subunit B n=1 Tax=Flavimaricola marinus TaxID=1819565 RepID=A0A238L9Y4_9RHOB|nr:hypothetical protein [Flavimaricola marinus]SMY06527.1 hypothetical protein LOM8899_00654 [Flavimaricola marinus]
MRLILLISCLACSPAAAWEFSATPICTLSHETEDAAVVVTYDATLPEYTISVTRAEPWPDAAIFAMTFDGGLPLTIQTDRHVLSADRLSLTVTDRGFGNVLNGLERNRIALAVAGGAVAALPLDGIEEPMQAFRSCPQVGLS